MFTRSWPCSRPASLRSFSKLRKHTFNPRKLVTTIFKENIFFPFVSFLPGGRGGVSERGKAPLLSFGQGMISERYYHKMEAPVFDQNHRAVARLGVELTVFWILLKCRLLSL